MRKLLGMLALLIFLTIYIVAAILIGSRISGAHWAINLAFYVVAGVLWALPLKPLMRWMHAHDKPLPSTEL